MRSGVTALVMLALAGGTALAGEADVIKVEAHHSSARTYTFADAVSSACE